MDFTIALLQMTAAGNDQAANLAKGERFCREARRRGADLALFPEMWNIGYTFFAPDELDDPDAVAAWQAQAIDAESDFVRHFRSLARELEMAIAITYLEAWEGAPRNTVAVIDRRGDLRLTYAKVHTCAFSSEVALAPGDGFHVAALPTAQGKVQIGAMICYDREFPESARALMLQGAEIILTPNACPLGMHRLAQFRTRAYENMVGVAMTNYAAPQENGHAIAYDGMAFGKDEQPRDMLIVEAGEQEGIYLAPFDMARLRDYRQREAWGNAFRRPHAYHDLIDPEIRPPFQRTDARGRPFRDGGS